MRDLAERRHVAVIFDGQSGDSHEIYYRRPTTEELAGYQNGMLRRSGKRVLLKTFEQRLAMGRRVITGIKKGTLGYEGRPFSSEPDDPDYREDWLSILVSEAPDIVAAVAVAAFESTGVSREEVEIPLDE